MEQRNLGERIVKNSFWGFIHSFVKRVGALIFTIILARFLMPENYGIYSIVLSTVMILYTFADLGVNETLERFTALAIKKNKKKVPSYHRYLLKIKLILSISTSILLIILAYPLSKYFFKNMALFLPFIVASFFVFVLALEGFYTRFFYPIEKVKYLSFRGTLTQVLRIVLVLLVFYFIASSYHVIGIFISLILANAIVLIWVLFKLKKLIPSLFSKSKEKINKKEVRRFVKILTIATISVALFFHVDAIILGFFLLPEYVGYYKAAFSIIVAVASLIAFPNIVLLSFFTKINKLETQKVLDNMLKYLAIFTIPSSFALAIFSKHIIRLFYGASYLPSSLPFYFLAFLILPVAGVGTFLAMFSAKGKPQIFAKLIVITGIINIVLNIIFIKLFLSISQFWAMAGVAIATLITWIIYFLAAIYITKKRLNFKISFKPAIRPLIASLIMAGVLFYLLFSVKEVGIVLGIFIILLGALIYLILMLLFKGITKEDLRLFKLLIKK